MKKNIRLKLCNNTLLGATVVMLASSIQLEAIRSNSTFWVLVHMIIGIAFIAMIIWHIYLHFRWKSWWKRLYVPARPLMKWLTVTGVLIALSSMVTGIYWLSIRCHSGIGGFHGKIGFVFLIVVAIHIWKHRKFYAVS